MKTKIDSIVVKIINQFRKRSRLGIKKYGTTLDENNKDNFLQHLKEELMDALLYIEKKQSQEYDSKLITRFEVIDDEGRSYVAKELTNFEISIQDEGRTCKLFISKKQK